MDELTALFANKPTSYLGDGIIYNGDTRGNGVSSTEQDVVVIPRFNPKQAGEFKGCGIRSGARPHASDHHGRLDL
jgi:hypothetical protein